jgi:hypothetical protein
VDYLVHVLEAFDSIDGNCPQRPVINVLAENAVKGIDDQGRLP